MPTFNTDWILYSSVYTPSTNLTSGQINAINNAPGGTPASIGGIGHLSSFALQYTTSNLGIPLDATILGFDIKIRNRLTIGATNPLSNNFYTNTIAPDGTNSPFGNSQGRIEQVLSSTTTNTYDLGYSFTGETGLRPDNAQTVPLIDLIANDNLCLLFLCLGDETSFQGILFNDIAPSIAIRIHYKTLDPIKIKLGSGPSTSVSIPYEGASLISSVGFLGSSQNSEGLSPGNTSGVAYFDKAIHEATDYYQLSNFGFNIPEDAVIEQVKLQIGVDRENLSFGSSNFQLMFWFGTTGPEFLKRNSITYTSTENHAVREYTYINSQNNNFFTPNIINNLRLRIYWPVNVFGNPFDTDIFRDTITGTNPSTPTFSTSFGSVYIGGTPGSNTGQSPSGTNHPQISVTYSFPQYKFKLQDSGIIQTFTSDGDPIYYRSKAKIQSI